MSDQVIANLLNKIKQQQPAAIGLDLYRDFPVEPGHQALVKVFETTPNLIVFQQAFQAYEFPSFRRYFQKKTIY